MRRWYVVEALPRSEERAAINLQRQGMRTYLPRYRKRRRHARKVELVPAALFPGYLFVRLDVAAEPWRRVNGTFGCRQLVCDGEMPAPLPRGVIRALKAREDEDGFVLFGLPSDSFCRGDRVRITDGPLAERMGLVDSVTDAQRVVLLLDMLGRRVRVQLDADYISAA
ncbi:transcription termination/antitermination protein NusG [Marinibaculum pumilum]|uniref:Transcription termination/antitermination protein NusG n=1 Tax=Marinibaculum pumilum TaxID=1766165 RepID=A0ABV7KXY4_9PROT